MVKLSSGKKYAEGARTVIIWNSERAVEGNGGAG
jgi:hypothetical protein